MKVICMNNNKGGSLKTTTTTNIAGVLATKGKKVLIIDADNQSNVLLSFGLNPDQYESGLFDVLVNGTDPRKVIIDVHENIDVLPSNDDLIGFDFKVIGNPGDFTEPFSLMRKSCDGLRDLYDYILIDTPPSLSLMVGNVFTFADSVLIPYAPENYSMRSLVKVIDTIDDFRLDFNPNLRILGVLATMVNFQTTLHQEVMQETRKFCVEKDIEMFETYIPRTIRFASAVAYNRLPATLLKSTNDVSSTYFELWKEIEEKHVSIKQKK